MHFRVRDMLLMVALAASYLAANKYALNNAEEGVFARLPINTLTVSFFSAPLFLILIPECLRWLAVRKAKPIVCEFRTFLSWRSHLVISASFWAYAMVCSPIDTFFKALLFAVISVTVLVIAGLSILPINLNSIEVGSRGIVCRSTFAPWSKIEFVRGADNTIVQLKIREPWPGVTVDVPPQHREQISQLLQIAKAEDK